MGQADRPRRLRPRSERRLAGCPHPHKARSARVVRRASRQKAARARVRRRTADADLHGGRR